MHGGSVALFRLLAHTFARSSYSFCDVCIALVKVGVDILFLPSPNNLCSALALTINVDVGVDVWCPRCCQRSVQLLEPLCERARGRLSERKRQLRALSQFGAEKEEEEEEVSRTQPSRVCVTSSGAIACRLKGSWSVTTLRHGSCSESASPKPG